MVLKIQNQKNATRSCGIHSPTLGPSMSLSPHLCPSSQTLQINVFFVLCAPSGKKPSERGMSTLNEFFYGSSHAVGPRDVLYLVAKHCCVQVPVAEIQNHILQPVRNKSNLDQFCLCWKAKRCRPTRTDPHTTGTALSFFCL